MISNILIAIIFAFLINYIVSLQLLAQFSETKRTKNIAIGLALFLGFLSGILLLI